MSVNTLFLAGRYAKAYDALAKDNAQAQVNLDAFNAALTALKEAEGYIENPTLPLEVKNDILAKILTDGKAASFIRLLVSQKRFYLAGEISRQLAALLDIRLGLKRVSVAAAAVFDDNIKAKINTALEGYFNSKVSVEYREESALLAGLTIRQGDILIDGSAEGRIKQLTKNLTEK